MECSYVQYGCGVDAPTTWLNFDASPTLRLQRIPLIKRFFMNDPYVIFPQGVRYGDIVKGLPISNGSCRAIYCSHILEHLSLEEFRIALRNTFTYLNIGGIFRFVMPDLEQLASDYLNSHDPQAACRFMQDSYLGRTIRPRGFTGQIRNWLGNTAHLWLWDYKAVVTELEAVGFEENRRASFGDSEDVRFQDVEKVERWVNCLGLECHKIC